MFYFPMPSTGNDYYVIELPFFENVAIQESKRARYQKYSLISRSSNLYSYLGADSRMLNLTFNMSLPHLLEEHPDINLDKYISYMQDKDNSELEKQKFLEPYKVQSIPKGMAFQLGTKYTKSLARDSAKQVLNSLESTLSGSLNVEDREHFGARYGLESLAISQIAQTPTSVVTDRPNTGFQQNAIEYNETQQLKYRIIDLIIYWTNIIRSSVVNYSKNPIYGPPIIRLRHGILYQDIPCICTDYSIDYNEAAGYDLDTLLPRQLKINLKLEEIRTGDFGEFIPKGNPIERDNLAGWEAVILGETNSMDPGYTND
tara:strand:+ start:3680 stop:4624 length:945 start_codon:yes stop_codon:yes gene_type:complete